MKKRLFLGILPALLILSACNGGVQQIEDNNIFLEDTLAHEEIFGGEETGNRDLKPYRLNDDPVTHPDSDASIGVQFFIDDKGTVDESDDMVSIRFVAAVTFNESNITPTNAVWTRTVSSPDGTTFPKDTGTYECKKAYKKLNSGGAVYTIEQFNGAQEPDTSYTHFVVYTLRNIPKVTYANYYVSAYLTLSDGLSQTTKAIAVSVNGNEKYTYNPFEGKFFMVGSWSDSIIEPTTVREGENKASFENKVLSAGSSFVIKEFYNTKLEVHRYSTKRGNVSDYYLADGSGSFVTNYYGEYNFYLKYVEDSPGVGHNELYTKAKVYSRQYFVDLGLVTWWTNQGAKPELYVYKNAQGSNPKVEEFIKLEQISDTNIWKTPGNVDLTRYAYAIVARRNPENLNTWWNQTPDISINDYDDGSIKNCIKVKDSSEQESNKKDYAWETRL